MLRRRTRLARTTGLRPRRRTQRRSERQRDSAYLAFVRGLPCALMGDDCAGRTEAHHAGRRPFGRKADDTTAIPLCSHHHERLTNAGWSRESRRALEASAIAVTQSMWARMQLDTELTIWREVVGLFVCPLSDGWGLYLRNAQPYLWHRDGREREVRGDDASAHEWALIVEEWLDGHQQMRGPKADKRDRQHVEAAMRAVAVWRGIETTTVTK